jgi:hypothetical protein
MSMEYTKNVFIWMLCIQVASATVLLFGIFPSSLSIGGMTANEPVGNLMNDTNGFKNTMTNPSVGGLEYFTTLGTIMLHGIVMIFSIIGFVLLGLVPLMQDFWIPLDMAILLNLVVDAKIGLEVAGFLSGR